MRLVLEVLETIHRCATLMQAFGCSSEVCISRHLAQLSGRGHGDIQSGPDLLVDDCGDILLDILHLLNSFVITVLDQVGHVFEEVAVCLFILSLVVPSNETSDVVQDVVVTGVKSSELFAQAINGVEALVKAFEQEQCLADRWRKVHVVELVEDAVACLGGNPSLSLLLVHIFDPDSELGCSVAQLPSGIVDLVHDEAHKFMEHDWILDGSNLVLHVGDCVAQEFHDCVDGAISL